MKRCHLYRLTSSLTVPLEVGISDTTESKQKERWIGVLYEAEKVVVRSPLKFLWSWFAENTQELVQWECLPLLVPRCCDILETKNISAVRYGIAKKRPYYSRMVSEDNIIGDAMPAERSVRRTKMFKSHFL